MSNSYFSQRLDKISSKKNELDKELQVEILKAVDSFIKTTEVDQSDVFFYQYGNEVLLGELTNSNGVMSFEWGLIVSHEGDHLQAACSVHVAKTSYHNAEDEVTFQIGQYDPNGGGLEKKTFMKNLIDHLMVELEKQKL